MSKFYTTNVISINSCNKIIEFVDIRFVGVRKLDNRERFLVDMSSRYIKILFDVRNLFVAFFKKIIHENVEMIFFS